LKTRFPFTMMMVLGLLTFPLVMSLDHYLHLLGCHPDKSKTVELVATLVRAEKLDREAWGEYLGLSSLGMFPENSDLYRIRLEEKRDEGIAEYEYIAHLSQDPQPYLKKTVLLRFNEIRNRFGNKVKIPSIIDPISSWRPPLPVYASITEDIAEE